MPIRLTARPAHITILPVFMTLAGSHRSKRSTAVVTRW